MLKPDDPCPVCKRMGLSNDLKSHKEDTDVKSLAPPPPFEFNLGHTGSAVLSELEIEQGRSSEAKLFIHKRRYEKLANAQQRVRTWVLDEISWLLLEHREEMAKLACEQVEGLWEGHKSFDIVVNFDKLECHVETDLDA